MISIMINVHNEGEEILQTIKSIQSSTSYEMEFIVVDDASTDNSCTNLGSNVKVLRNKKRLGIGRSKNKGAALSTGDILIFTDGHIRITKCPFSFDQAINLAKEKESIIVPAVGNFTNNTKWYKEVCWFLIHTKININTSPN